VDFKKESDDIVCNCNNWVKDVTKANISSIIDKIDSDTIALFLNAIYFYGKWEIPFDKKFTKKLSFYNFGDKNQAKAVPFMFKRKISCKLFSDKLQEMLMLELPYCGNISMFILMSKEIEGLEKVYSILDSTELSKMKLIYDIINLWLPKFKLEAKYQLTDIMKKMGMSDAFSECADFGKIRKLKDIFISKIIHKAMVDVNEKGTKAAAATGGMLLGGKRKRISYID
ncbi:plasminogen activator inhibitor 2-like protein, partial [Dinothrombium tinctorium]